MSSENITADRRVLVSPEAPELGEPRNVVRLMVLRCVLAMFLLASVMLAGFLTTNSAANRIDQIRERLENVELADPATRALQLELKTAGNQLFLVQVLVLVFGLMTVVGTGVFVLWPMIAHVQSETYTLNETNKLYARDKDELANALRKLRTEREDRRGRVRAMASVMEDLEQEKSALHREISTRQKVQDALEASEQRFYAIVESAPTAMLMIDRVGAIVLANAETEKLFGYNRDELLRLSVEDLVPERFRQSHPHYRQEFFDHPAARRMGVGRDLYGLRKDGSEFPIEIGLNPIEMSDGLYVLSAIVDNTERKRAEEEIRRVNVELKQKNAEMQQFVYTVSHDLKSPLVTCKGFVGLLKEDLEAGRMDDLRDSIGRIDRATERMGLMIEDLLQLSRIGTIRNEIELVDVSELVSLLIDESNYRMEQVGVEVMVQEKLPDVWADPGRLAEVFENLIGNALKYGCGNEHPRIEIGGQKDAKHTRFFVRDNGQGIETEFHEKVFGLFQRLEAGNDGTGVGLAAVARIMETHRGRAWVESEEGNGATFWIEFPNR